MPRRLLLLALVLAGCREDVELFGNPDGGGPTIPGLVSLEVSPADTQVVIDDLAVPQDVAYTATGTFDGGDTRDVTDLVAWGTDNPAPGAFVAAGDWRSSNAAGGPVVVGASANGMTATADLSVILEPSIQDPSFPPPPGADDLFDTLPVGSDPGHSPAIVYPANQVMFPVNLYRVLFQYDTAAGTDVYQLHFVSPYLDMRVTTTSDRWQADATSWAYLALTDAGSDVTMTVSAIDLGAPDTAWASAPITLSFSAQPVGGAIYYWSTSSQGVMKGSLASATPEKFYTEAPDTTCVACHTVSRDGKRLAVGYDGEKLQEVNVPDRDVVIPAGTYDSGWSTFSPDGTRLLVGNKGALTLVDADTGASLGAVPLGAAHAVHPDWSPLGDYVAVAVCTMAGDNRNVSGCSIGRIPYNGGAWGAIETLVPAAGGMDNNFFPRYSPDGQWIVYVNAQGASKDQVTSVLRLIPAGGGTPRTLTRANERVGPDDGVTGIANTMPTWAPTTDGGLEWVAFSSVRAYGKVAVGADQLWAVAIDPAAPDDASYAAFWLPMQEVGERNHRAFWAVDAALPPEVCNPCPP
jgi:hypothetical protein